MGEGGPSFGPSFVWEKVLLTPFLEKEVSLPFEFSKAPKPFCAPLGGGPLKGGDKNSSGELSSLFLKKALKVGGDPFFHRVPPKDPPQGW